MNKVLSVTSYCDVLQSKKGEEFALFPNSKIILTYVYKFLLTIQRNFRLVSASDFLEIKSLADLHNYPEKLLNIQLLRSYLKLDVIYKIVELWDRDLKMHSGSSFFEIPPETQEIYIQALYIKNLDEERIGNYSFELKMPSDIFKADIINGLNFYRLFLFVGFMLSAYRFSYLNNIVDFYQILFASIAIIYIITTKRLWIRVGNKKSFKEKLKFFYSSEYIPPKKIKEVIDPKSTSLFKKIIAITLLVVCNILAICMSLSFLFSFFGTFSL